MKYKKTIGLLALIAVIILVIVLATQNSFFDSVNLNTKDPLEDIGLSPALKRAGAHNTEWSRDEHNTQTSNAWKNEWGGHEYYLSMYQATGHSYSYSEEWHQGGHYIPQTNNKMGEISWWDATHSTSYSMARSDYNPVETNAWAEDKHIQYYSYLWKDTPHEYELSKTEWYG